MLKLEQDLTHIGPRTPIIPWRRTCKVCRCISEGLGTLKGVEPKICVDSEAKPKYVKGRSMSYTLEFKSGAEWEGITLPIAFSEWEAPIAPVTKPNGSLRIWGNYKLMVNQVSKLENYPISKTEDLLATLGGGDKFTKLNCPKPVNRRSEMKNLRSLQLTHIKVFFSTSDYHLEFPLCQGFFRGHWRTSCKVSLKSLYEWMTSSWAGKMAMITSPI